VTHGLGNLFGFAAGLTATYFLEHYAYPINLRYLFWIGFASSFISPLLIANFREVPFPVERLSVSLKAFLRNTPAHAAGAPGFLRFMLVRTALGVGILANAFYALYALEQFDLQEGYLGVFTVILLLSQSAFGLFWGWLGDRVGFKIVYVLTAGMVAAMGALALSGVGSWAFYVIAALIGGFYAAIRTGDPNMIFELAPPAETSRFVGISNTFVAPILTLTAVSGGFIAERFSYEALFGAVLLAGLGTLVLTILYMPNPRREMSPV
jgi:MFS family permease